MSGWGTKVYENDMAQDVEQDIRSLLSVGKSVDQIMEYVMRYCPEDRDEEECAFWTSLALTLWKYGILPTLVRDKTVDVIDKNNDAEVYLSDKDKEKRRGVLTELRNTLLSTNPKPLKVKKVFVDRTQFCEGDVLSLAIGEYYIFLQVVKIERSKHEIEELRSDSVYVKVFDISSRALLSVQQLESVPYKQLESDEQIQVLSQNAKLYPPYRGLSEVQIVEHKFIRLIYCCSDTEKKKMEGKLRKVGNLPYASVTCRCVYENYQYAKLENTFRELFALR